MGVDITLVAETKPTPGSPWTYVPGPLVDCRSSAHSGIVTLDDRLTCAACELPTTRWGSTNWSFAGRYGKVHGGWWDDRSYAIFSVLTDGRFRDEFHQPIVAETRGYPLDCSHEVRQRMWIEYNDKGRLEDNGHWYANWLTLDEIFAYPWPEWAGRFLERIRMLNHAAKGRLTRIVFDFS